MLTAILAVALAVAAGRYVVIDGVVVRGVSTPGAGLESCERVRELRASATGREPDPWLAGATKLARKAGKKGANVADITKLQRIVPPGRQDFTATAYRCAEQIVKALSEAEGGR